MLVPPRDRITVAEPFVRQRPLKVRPAVGFGLHEVYVEGGGPVPYVLQGRYTSEEYALKAIDVYGNN